VKAKGASEEIVSTLKRVVTLFDKTSEARVTGPSLEAIRFLLDLAKEHSQVKKSLLVCDSLLTLTLVAC
jgi:hypothetical protein